MSIDTSFANLSQNFNQAQKMLILLQGFKIEPIAIEGLVILKNHSTLLPPPLQILPLCYTFIFLYTLYIYIYSYTRGASHTPLYPLPICLSLREGVLESSKGGGGGGRMRPPKGFSLLLSSLQPSLQLFSPVI